MRFQATLGVLELHVHGRQTVRRKLLLTRRALGLNPDKGIALYLQRYPGLPMVRYRDPGIRVLLYLHPVPIKRGVALLFDVRKTDLRLRKLPR